MQGSKASIGCTQRSQFTINWVNSDQVKLMGELTMHCNEKSLLCIPFLGIARPQSQPSSCDYERFIDYGSVHISGSRIGRSIVGIYKMHSKKITEPMLSNWILHQLHFHWGNSCLFLPPTTCFTVTVNEIKDTQFVLLI